MRATIYEYEFRIIKNGKKYTVQQSETTRANAVKKLQKKIQGIDDIIFVKKLSYPHYEGGKKAR